MTARRHVAGRCAVDIEHSPESLHVHAIPIDVLVEPGDRVLVHDAPAIGPGDCFSCECRITVERAGVLRRTWTRARSLFAITELYDVGFEAEMVP